MKIGAVTSGVAAEIRCAYSISFECKPPLSVTQTVNVFRDSLQAVTDEDERVRIVYDVVGMLHCGERCTRRCL
jgi:hypothetical protein